MRISDWSSYVCSSDLVGHAVDDDRRAADAVAFVADFFIVGAVGAARAALDGALDVVLGHVGVGGLVPGHAQPPIAVREIGRASCRERVCPSEVIPWVADSLKEKHEQHKKNNLS